MCIESMPLQQYQDPWGSPTGFTMMPFCNFIRTKIANVCQPQISAVFCQAIGWTATWSPKRTVHDSALTLNFGDFEFYIGPNLFEEVRKSRFMGSTLILCSEPLQTSMQQIHTCKNWGWAFLKYDIGTLFEDKNLGFSSQTRQANHPWLEGEGWRIDR